MEQDDKAVIDFIMRFSDEAFGTIKMQGIARDQPDEITLTFARTKVKHDPSTIEYALVDVCGIEPL